ncbi:MAG: 4a-hydroxytetrahydrobiopterin dehydratase [Phycisphaerales bacterium]|nr:4a-hydroxytetrahydrobiopterin dehydratase [Phycisphaerales bacterium]
MSKLRSKRCIPCEKGTPPLKGLALVTLSAEVPKWSVVDESRLTRDFKFPDFATALRFVNRAGEIAEQEQHHPDIRLSWGKAGFEIWTHSIGGLSENDFILAAKIDALAD